MLEEPRGEEGKRKRKEFHSKLRPGAKLMRERIRRAKSDSVKTLEPRCSKSRAFALVHIVYRVLRRHIGQGDGLLTLASRETGVSYSKHGLGSELGDTLAREPDYTNSRH